MVTVAADAIAGTTQLAIKRVSSVVAVVDGEYPIIELCIYVAMFHCQYLSSLKVHSVVRLMNVHMARLSHVKKNTVAFERLTK